MAESEGNDAVWERRIRWVLLISAVVAFGLPILWTKDVLTMAQVIAICAVLWVALVGVAANRVRAAITWASIRDALPGGPPLIPSTRVRGGGS